MVMINGPGVKRQNRGRASRGRYRQFAADSGDLGLVQASGRPGCVLMAVNITSRLKQTFETGTTGSEAGFDSGFTGAATTGVAADRCRIGTRSGPGKGDGGDEVRIALRPGAVCGVAGRNSRRPGVCGCAGMLECAECVLERSGRRGAVVDEPVPGGRGADVSKEGLRVRCRKRLQLLPLHPIDAGIAKNPG